MKTRRNSFPALIFKLLFGIFILFLGYRMIHFELSLQRYEKAFLQVKHPENIARIDAFDLEVKYYPATYVDDSTQFQSMFLVGEIRSYSGDWNALKMFYADQPLEVNNSMILPVWSLPLRIYRNDQKSGLDFPRDFLFDPFQANILQSLQEYYHPEKISQHLGETEGSVYFVYMMDDP